MTSLVLFNETDNRFQSRVHSALQTAQAWDDDPLLLAECRCLIPLASLSDDHGDYSEPSDLQLHSKDHRFVRRLARFFKQNVMVWVNQPPCSACGSTEIEAQGTRGPESLEEKEGAASRVEVYVCLQCQAITTFPRYNSCRKLLETRRGRCGEYANLFRLYCRACGFETRYVSDWTDHVWTEVWIQGHWVMVDSCEAVVDECSMYEVGWGKKLNMIVAAAKDHVIDITARYTRQFTQSDFQARRRLIVTSEQQSRMIIRSCNDMLQSGMKPKVRDGINRRLHDEEQLLEALSKQIYWEKQYHHGRISGSLAWKVLRHETGSQHNEEQTNDDDHSDTWCDLESYYPPTDKGVYIGVASHPQCPHGGIIVSGVNCAAGTLDALSVVVVDEVNIGCILQSKSFQSLEALANFVDSIPTNRVVAIQGALKNNQTATDAIQAKLRRLPGFRIDCVSNGVLFIGQVNTTPAAWTVCETYGDQPVEKIVKLNVPMEPKGLQLVRFVGARPASVVGRLPDSVMAQSKQLTASDDEKRQAFEDFVTATESKSAYSGFTSRKGGLVYLLGAAGFPLERTRPSDEAWTTCLLLPPQLALHDESPSSKDKVPTSFEVPVDTAFFMDSVGPQLLVKRNGDWLELDTVSALAGARLVAFYFSAHWCGPCRSFTPMLAEMYLHLKEVFPTHGLEIIFVSSDRDQQSFSNYFSTMPWLAVPFTSLEFYKRQLSAIYGVQGIPSLVVLDCMTGQLVSDARLSRGEVVQACQRGDHGIKALFSSWMDRLPESTKEMARMLEVSCIDDKVDAATPKQVAGYLRRTSDISTNSDIECSPMNDLFVLETSSSPEREGLFLVSNEAHKAALKTILAYIENCSKEPYNPKFRSFKLSNKVADRITHVAGGIYLIHSLGLEVVGMDDDFFVSIPVGTDLDATGRCIKALLDREEQS